MSKHVVSVFQMHALSLRDEIRTPRRHSATHHEANSTRCSPRSGGCRWDDPLSVPVFKARSPAATDLKNSIAVDSRKSDSLRKLEDKWQVSTPLPLQTISNRLGCFVFSFSICTMFRSCGIVHHPLYMFSRFLFINTIPCICSQTHAKCCFNSLGTKKKAFDTKNNIFSSHCFF